jgi:hypothetical protein
MGRMAFCAPVGNRRYVACFDGAKRVINPLQVTNLSHKKTMQPRGHSISAIREHIER